MHVCVHVCACVHVCECMCVHVCACVCEHNLYMSLQVYKNILSEKDGGV